MKYGFDTFELVPILFLRKRSFFSKLIHDLKGGIWRLGVSPNRSAKVAQMKRKDKAVNVNWSIHG